MVSSPPSFHLIKDGDPGDDGARAFGRREGPSDRRAIATVSNGWRSAPASASGFPRSGLIDLSYGAYLHDIGKVRVPDDILGKAGPLTGRGVGRDAAPPGVRRRHAAREGLPQDCGEDRRQPTMRTSTAAATRVGCGEKRSRSRRALCPLSTRTTPSPPSARTRRPLAKQKAIEELKLERRNAVRPARGARVPVRDRRGRILPRRWLGRWRHVVILVPLGAAVGALGGLVWDDFLVRPRGRRRIRSGVRPSLRAAEREA